MFDCGHVDHRKIAVCDGFPCGSVAVVDVDGGVFRPAQKQHPWGLVVGATVKTGFHERGEGGPLGVQM